jgi:hypothetical protein
VSYLGVRKAPALIGLILTVALLVAGCGGGTDVDYTKAAETIQASIESPREGFGVEVEGVECQTGVKVEVGAHFECAVQFPGGKVRYAQVKIRDAKADLSLESLSPKRFGD